MNKQEQLLYLTKLESQAINNSKLKAIRARWKGKTAHLTFYFVGNITEEDIESASDICGEIIAHFPNSLLKEEYIQLDNPHALPSDDTFLC